MKGLAAIPESGLRRAIDTVLPPLCMKCRAVVDAPGSLCAACWPELDFIAPPFCTQCGFPFDFDAEAGAGGRCGGCLRNAPPYQRARAVLRYDDQSKPLVLGFKHGDKTHLAGGFAEWLARAGADLLAETDVIVPVPLHWRRLLGRRYNQSALIARRLAKLSGKPYRPELLLRRRNTETQGHLTAAQRKRNVQGAFVVPVKRRGTLAGRRVLLVDDVFTTGATAEACTNALLRGGADAVDVLVLARVVRPWLE